MLDLKFVVENRDAVLRALEARGQSLESVQAFPGLDGDPWTLDGERRALIQQTEELRHEQRSVGEEIARRGKAKEDATALKAEMKGVAERIKQGEARLDEVKAAIERFLLVVPNLPDASVPVGRDAADNQELRRVGEPRAFDFTPKGHAELGVELGILVSHRCELRRQLVHRDRFRQRAAHREPMAHAELVRRAEHALVDRAEQYYVRRAGPCGQRAQQLDTVGVGQMQLHHDQRRLERLEQLHEARAG